MSACFGAGNLSVTNPACLIIGRNPQTGGLDGEPSSTKGIFLASSNLGRLKTDGIDLTVNYRRDIGFADLSMALNGNWTNSSTFQATPSSINRECVGQMNPDCGSLQPKLQWSLRTTLGFEKVDVSMLWRHIDGFSGDSEAFKGTINGWGNVDFTKIPSYDYFDLTTRVKITDNLTLTGTVQNLFNKQPPLVGATIGSTAFNSGNTYPSTYDTLGRRYAASLKVTF
jgi:outer membrane receptor protein involved in Fe transport